MKEIKESTFILNDMATAKRKSSSEKKKLPLTKKGSAPAKKKSPSKLVVINPSEVYDTPWIFAESTERKNHQLSENSGKWIIYVWSHNLDLVWNNIKSATEKGILGPLSKASTALPSPLAPKPNLKVIVVYTYDFTDNDDVMRVRQALREIGIISKIAYKTDDATRMRQYSSLKKGRVSLYYE